MSTSLVQGALFTVMVLRLGEVGVADFERALRAQVGKSPQFFANAPVVVDLKGSPPLGVADFTELKRVLRELELVPIGVQNCSAAQQSVALKAGFGTLPASPRRAVQQQAPQPQAAAAPEPAPAAAPAARSLLITEPVRSGTQIYARGGDLIVTKSVSPGAELIADGHIHVYGTLRGRAIAGATGDGTARIFVRRLEAELLSIAGRYLVSDQIGAEHLGKTAQVLLQDERMMIVGE